MITTKKSLFRVSAERYVLAGSEMEAIEHVGDTSILDFTATRVVSPDSSEALFKFFKALQDQEMDGSNIEAALIAYCAANDIEFTDGLYVALHNELQSREDR